MLNLIPYESPIDAINEANSEGTALVGSCSTMLVQTSTMFLSALLGSGVGLIFGVLIGFFGGSTVFADGGDFTMIYVTSCVLIGGACGAATGAGAGMILSIFASGTAEHPPEHSQGQEQDLDSVRSMDLW